MTEEDEPDQTYEPTVPQEVMSDDYVESEDKPMIEPSSLIKKLF
jgi:hypothetical protein